MTNTSRWPITIDGTRLDTYAWNVRTRAGRDLAASVKTANLDQPLLNGELWVPGKKVGPGRMVLQMWVSGVDANGVAPVDGDTYWVYRQNLDSLRRIFGKRYGLLDVQQTVRTSPATVRQALCEVTAVIDPDFAAPAPYTGQFTVELSIPDAWWQDPADSNFDTGTSITSGTTYQMTTFAAATAPCEDLYTVVDGPATNPKWTDQPSGHFVQLSRALLAGEQWVVNTSKWTSKIGTGIAFTDNGTNVASQTSYGGYLAPRMFGLSPLNPNPRVVLSWTAGGTTATRGRIRGKVKYQ
jgi:hypothetical protein